MIKQVTAGETRADPGPLGGGKMMDMTHSQPAKAVDCGHYDGGAWDWCQSQS